MRSFLLIALLALPACIGRAGTSLKKEDVREIRAEVEQPALCPGLPVRFAVLATTSTGEQLATLGYGEGRVGWRNYRVEVQGGSVVEPGVLALDADPRTTWDTPGRLQVGSEDPFGLVWGGPLPARWDCAFVAELDGMAGQDGRNGRDGPDGGPGSAGGDGEHGRPGLDGSPGPALDVRVALAPAAAGRPDLLQVEVRAPGQEPLRYAVDPGAGSLEITARGGKGGHGGRGGDGGDGGQGSQTERPGQPGTGGDGGDGGDGGRGGSIVVRVDPAAEPYLAALRFENGGGAAGLSGASGRGGGGGGVDGETGRDGEAGPPGPPVEVLVEVVAARW